VKWVRYDGRSPWGGAIGAGSVQAPVFLAKASARLRNEAFLEIISWKIICL
jgi:hypothetical protein